MSKRGNILSVLDELGDKKILKITSVGAGKRRYEALKPLPVPALSAMADALYRFLKGYCSVDEDALYKEYNRLIRQQSN